MIIARLFIVVIAATILSSCTPGEPRGPVIFAASSLQEPLEAIAEEWVATGGDPPIFSFASSATLARQIQNGSPADIFISADTQWTDYLRIVGRLPPDATAPIAANSLVVAQSIRGNSSLKTTDVSDALRQAGSIATGDPDTVPLGRYARQALEQAALWDMVSPRIIGASSSSAALKLVLLGEAEIGILYASDAARRGDLRVLNTIAQSDHDPIIYQAVQLPGSAHPDAARFVDLLQSAESRSIFGNRGFARP